MTFDLRGLSHPAQAFLNATPSMQSLAKRTRYSLIADHYGKHALVLGHCFMIRST